MKTIPFFQIEDLLKIASQDPETVSISLAQDVFLDLYPHEISASELDEEVLAAFRVVGRLLVQQGLFPRSQFELDFFGRRS